MQQNNVQQSLNYAKQGSQLVNQYIVSPVANLGIAGFVFSNGGHQEIDLKADITDHYVENNTAVQDNRAIKPLHFKVDGYIGELVYTAPSSQTGILQSIFQKITTISSYLSIATSAGRQAYSKISSSKNTAGDYTKNLAAGGADLYKAFKQINPPKTAQAQAYNYFAALFNNNSLLFSIQTPWTFITNMAIESLHCTQPDETDQRTDFSITFKQIRYVDTQFVQFNSDKYSDRTANQISGVENTVKAQGVKKGPLVSNFAKVLNVPGANVANATNLITKGLTSLYQAATP